MRRVVSIEVRHTDEPNSCMMLLRRMCLSAKQRSRSPVRPTRRAADVAQLRELSVTFDHCRLCGWQRG